MLCGFIESWHCWVSTWGVKSEHHVWLPTDSCFLPSHPSRETDVTLFGSRRTGVKWLLLYTALSILNLLTLKKPIFPFTINCGPSNGRRWPCFPMEGQLSGWTFLLKRNHGRDLIRGCLLLTAQIRLPASVEGTHHTSCSSGQINLTDFFRLSQRILDQVGGRITVNLFDSTRKPGL